MATHKVFASLTLASALCLAASLPAAAQSDDSVLKGDALRACLCLEQGINGAQSEMMSRRNAFDTAKSQVAAVDQEIATRRASMNVNDPAQVASFRALIDHRMALQASLDQQIYPADQSATDRYDRLVFQHHQQCDGRLRYQADVAAITAAGLTCPPLP
jgi:hypothetical protein